MYICDRLTVQKVSQIRQQFFSLSQEYVKIIIYRISLSKVIIDKKFHQI